MRPESPAKTRTKNQKAQSPKKTEKARTVRTLVMCQLDRFTPTHPIRLFLPLPLSATLIENGNKCLFFGASKMSRMFLGRYSREQAYSVT